MSGSPRRVFLGRERPPLEAAAAWLAAERGPDLGGLLVALPGARAGRRLAELLARALGPSWVPPRFLTDGRLTDELLLSGEPIAGRLVRTVVWERALRSLPAPALERLVARPPADSDAGAWALLAEEVRSLFGELAADGLDFHRAAAAAPREGGAGEAARWAVLAEVQETMEGELANAGLCDPHLARLAALERGAVPGEREVVLIGVVQASELLRRALEPIAERVTALVPAPPGEANDFDPFGLLIVERWAARDVPLDLGRWKVVQGPEDQAHAASDLLAEWSGRFTADQITLGICDPEVVPYLTRCLADAGIETRDAAGTPIERSPPLRLLAAAEQYLRTDGFAEFAALCRHPDLEDALRRELAADAPEAAEVLDRYLVDHLPASADGRGPEGQGPTRGELVGLHGAVLRSLGELAAPGSRPLPEWAGPVRAFLEGVYGAGELDAEGADRTLAACLDALGEGLAELEGCPASLAPRLDAAQALERLTALLRARSLPPPPARAGVPTIELLGWLELALDDAPVLVVTGFEEGRVPESVHGDAWLPDGLRQRLSLRDNEARLARDVYVACLLLASRSEVRFLSGRRSVAGDPLLPSRLAFHAPADHIPERVRHALGSSTTRRALAAPAPPAQDRALPRRAGATLPERFGVTSFRTYLESPYLFYLQHVLGVRTFDHDGRELDPAGFGDLAHQVLEILHRDPALRASPDERRLAAALDAELRRLSLARFGPRPLPAVALQVEQLAWRLRLFAERQATRAREGWRIAHAEWTPAEAHLDVDGGRVELRGRIDRIDAHADGRWALLDYKTGDSALKPGAAKAHRGRGGAWRDLQLPLYALLARELVGDGAVELGYAGLGRDEANIGFDLVSGWDEEVLESAYAAAREVVRRVRRGELFELGRGRPREPVLAALCGQGLLLEPAGEEQEDGEGEDDGEEGA